MMEKEPHYAVDTVSLFAVAFIDKNLGSAERCSLTRMNSLYNGMLSRMLSILRGSVWVESELVRLRPVI